MSAPIDETGAALSRAEDARRAEEARLLEAVRQGEPDQAVELAEEVAKAYQDEQ